MRSCHLDFETRSRIDLKKVGTDIYARDKSTEALCASFAFSDAPKDVRSWRIGQRCPDELADHIEDGGTIEAWNAAFESAIFRHCTSRIGWPVPRPEQYRCTMVAALALNLPGSLEKAADVVGAPVTKDLEGKKVMLSMTKPGRNGEFLFTEALLDRLVAYCEKDVLAEIGVGERTYPISAAEQELWLIDQRMNQRGVAIDRGLCHALIATSEVAREELDRLLSEATRLDVDRCSASKQITDWIRRRGYDTPGVSKAAIDDMLHDDELPDEIREVLLLRKDAARSSLAKLQQMLNRSAVDGRMRDNLQFYGAGTGRFSGRGAQLQNLARPVLAVQ